ncbi:hypothetical protein HK102_003088 [Quaeritorhiza haematococci]|nr:hypothetical protein HK102_003088 [Quaeritorhiza haematococci]
MLHLKRELYRNRSSTPPPSPSSSPCKRSKLEEAFTFAADLQKDDGGVSKKFFLFANHDAFWEAYRKILGNNELITHFSDELLSNGRRPLYPHHYETIKGHRGAFFYFDIDYMRSTLGFTDFVTELRRKLVDFFRSRDIDLGFSNLKMSASLDESGRAPWEPGFNGKFSLHLCLRVGSPMSRLASTSSTTGALTSWQQFRLPGSAKLGRNNVLVPFTVNGDATFEKLELTKAVFLEHLVCFPGEEGIHPQTVPECDGRFELHRERYGNKLERKREVGESELVKKERGSEVTVDGTLEGYLDCIPNTGDGQHWDVYFRIMAACHHETRGSLQGLEVFNRWSAQSSKHDQHQNGMQWNYMSSRNVANPVTLKTLRFIAKTCYPEAFEQAPETVVDAYFDYSSQAAGFFDEIVEVESRHLPPLDPHTFLEVCHSPVGSGKTTRAIELIRTGRFGSVIIPTPRRSLASELTAKLNRELHDMGIQFQLYSEIDTGGMPHCPFLVIQMESLLKLKLLSGEIPSYDLVLIDEIESVLMTFNSTTMKDGTYQDGSIARERPRTNRLVNAATVFEHLVKTAGKIVVMDAFILPKTIVALKDLLGRILGRRKKLVINKYKHSDVQSVGIPNVETFQSEIADLVKAGKNVAVFSSSRAVAMDLKEYLRKNSDVKIQVMKELKDVNRSWQKYQVVVYTPSITVGVSFDVPDYFHSIFVFAGTQSCTVRDMIQACFRIRHLESKTIYYHLAPPRFLKRYRTMTIEQTRAFVEKLIEIEQVSLQQDVYDTVSCLDWHKTPRWLQGVCCGNILEHHLSQSFSFSALFHRFFAETEFTPAAVSFSPPQPKSGRIPPPIKAERITAKFLRTETITQGQASYINEKMVQRRDVTEQERDELDKFNFVEKFDDDFAKCSAAQPIMADLYAKKMVFHHNYIDVLSLFRRGVFDASLGEQRSLVGFAEFQDSDMLRIRFGALLVQFLGFDSIFDTKDVLQEVTKDNPRMNTIITTADLEDRTQRFLDTHRVSLEKLFLVKNLVKGKKGANEIIKDLGVCVESVSSDPKTKGVRQKGWQLVNRIEKAYPGYRIVSMLRGKVTDVEKDGEGLDSQDSQDSQLDQIEVDLYNLDCSGEEDGDHEDQEE